MYARAVRVPEQRVQDDKKGPRITEWAADDIRYVTTLCGHDENRHMDLGGGQCMQCYVEDRPRHLHTFKVEGKRSKTGCRKCGHPASRHMNWGDQSRWCLQCAGEGLEGYKNCGGRPRSPRKADPRSSQQTASNDRPPLSTPGCIYVLSNVAMPSLVKIGMTTREAFARALELSTSTGVPYPFEVEAVFESSAPKDDACAWWGHTFVLRNRHDTCSE
jgi:T5orf172 domain